MVWKTYIFINNNLLYYKNWKQVKMPFLKKKCWFFDISNIKGVLQAEFREILKVIKRTGFYMIATLAFNELSTEFQISSVILTSFRRGVILPPHL